MLWHCHRAKEVWKEIGLDMDKIMDGCPEFLDLLWYARNVKQWPETAYSKVYWPDGHDGMGYLDEPN